MYQYKEGETGGGGRKKKVQANFYFKRRKRWGKEELRDESYLEN